MTVIIIVCSTLAYLLGARGTYGYLKYTNMARVFMRNVACSHGYEVLHKYESCHPKLYRETDTHFLRVLCALIWPLWMWMVFIGKLVSGNWGSTKKDNHA